MITDIVNKLIELRKMQSSNYNQTKKAFICDEAIAKIKELEDRLAIAVEALEIYASGRGTYYHADTALTKIGELDK